MFRNNVITTCKLMTTRNKCDKQMLVRNKRRVESHLPVLPSVILVSCRNSGLLPHSKDMQVS